LILTRHQCNKGAVFVHADTPTHRQPDPGNQQRAVTSKDFSNHALTGRLFAVVKTPSRWLFTGGGDLPDLFNPFVTISNKICGSNSITV